MFRETGARLLKATVNPNEYTFVGSAGGEDDDSGGDHLRRVLAAAACVLPADVHHPRHDGDGLRAAHLPAHLLAGHEQLHVQPHHLLLDERKVCLCVRDRRNSRGRGNCTLNVLTT